MAAGLSPAASRASHAPFFIQWGSSSECRVVFHKSRNSAKCCFAVCPQRNVRILRYFKRRIFQGKLNKSTTDLCMGIEWNMFWFSMSDGFGHLENCASFSVQGGIGISFKEAFAFQCRTYGRNSLPLRSVPWLNILHLVRWYPLVNVQKTMENHHFQWENPL